MDTYRSAEQNSSARTFNRRASATLVLIFTMLATAQAQDGAQQPQPQREAGPPPIRYMPPDVRQRLEGAKDAKARARLSMEIAEERLVRAAQLAGEDRFEASTAEIGIYEAVVEDDLKQAAAVIASFVYHTAMRDERLPREALPKLPPPPDTKASGN